MILDRMKTAGVDMGNAIGIGGNGRVLFNNFLITCLCKILKILKLKNENFDMKKKMLFFFSFAQNIDHGYML